MSALVSAALLNGRYHVLRPVGRGGMGAVYEAVDLRLRNTVAVKEMTAAGPDAREAFEREARLLAALRHHALPVVIDYFIEADTCFLVMQFIEGEDLAARLRRKGPCSEADAQRWCAAVLTALVYLHGLDSPVIHRDIKPSNIKLTPRGDVVLLDFGLAKGKPDAHTRPSGGDASFYGFTPNYAPPEQVQFQGTDARSDLYALGATLYHLLAGVAPPKAADRAAAMAAGEADPLARMTTASTFSASLAAVITRAMALEPAARFPTAAEMLRALTALAPGLETAPPRSNALLSPRPAQRLPAGTRRVDAATPSRAQLDRAIDLLVQIRFHDSPRLGLEDWPTRRRPDRLEQVSEAVKINYPVDRSTGRLRPARLRVKLVAPDFDIIGAGEQAIDVPPDEYSQRVAFLLMARRNGYCRVNVELYAADTLYLGALAIESEIVAELIDPSPLCTAELVLTVASPPIEAARDSARRSSDEQRALVEEVRRRGEAERQHLELARAGRDDGSTETAVPPQGDTVRPPTADRRPRPVNAQFPPLGTRVGKMATPMSEGRPGTSVHARVSGSSTRRWSAAGLSGAVMIILGMLIWKTWQQPTEPGASSTVAIGPRPTQPVPTPPTAIPAQPLVATFVPPERSDGTASLAIRRGPPPAGVTFGVSAERARTDMIRVGLSLTNGTSTSVRVSFIPANTYVTDGQGRRVAVAAVPEDAVVGAGRSVSQSLFFAVPDSAKGPFTLTLGADADDARAVRFPSVPLAVAGR